MCVCVCVCVCVVLYVGVGVYVHGWVCMCKSPMCYVYCSFLLGGGGNLQSQCQLVGWSIDIVEPIDM